MAGIALPLAAFGLGAGVALAAVLAPHGLHGITQYDDGVYFGAALRLVSGALPYRDFVLVQPPGIVVAMAPFAALAHLIGTASAMAVVRIVTAVVAGLNAALCARLLAPRGPVAALVAGVALAIFPAAFFADHTLLLEPYLVLSCLIGANLAIGRGEAGSTRLVLAGVALGLGGAVKLWAVAPALALLVVVAARGRPAVARYLLGIALGFVCCCLPFFVAAPGHFLHEVFVAQFGRQTTSPRQPLVRLWGIVGLHGLSLRYPYLTHRHAEVVVAAVYGAILLVGVALSALHRRFEAVEVFSLLAALATVGLLFIPVEYFDHYAYFPAPFLALALGCAVARIVGAVAAMLGAGRTRVGFSVAALLGLVAFAAATVGVVRVVADETAFDHSEMAHYPLLGPAIAAAVPARACASSDDVALLIEANRFFSSVPRCPDVVDADGTWLAEDPTAATGVRGPSDAELVQTWHDIFTRSDYVVLRAPYSFRIPFGASLRRSFTTDFRRVGGGNVAVYERR